jgi:hypothetical protein
LGLQFLGLQFLGLQFLGLQCCLFPREQTSLAHRVHA